MLVRSFFLFGSIFVDDQVNEYLEHEDVDSWAERSVKLTPSPEMLIDLSGSDGRMYKINS